MGKVTRVMRAVRWMLVVSMALVAACGGKATEAPKDPIAAAEAALAQGDARTALNLMTDTEGEAASAGMRLTIKARALVALSQWGEVEGLIARIADPIGKVLVRCELMAAQRDVQTVKTCAEAIKAADDAGRTAWGDEARMAQAEGYQADRRYGEAERILKDVVASRPTARARRVLVDYYERAGFVLDAIAALEAWRAAEPTAKGLDLKLALLVERKVKGDLLEKRADEALASAKRLRELVPTKEEFRYYVADALELKGDAQGAAAERAAAEATGAKPPHKPTDMPGMNGAGAAPQAPPGIGAAHAEDAGP